MKQYQVTKKFQVTIPKKMAVKAGISPGDAVTFDEIEGEITLRKADRQRRSPRQLSLALREFASDLEKIAPHVKEARRFMNENLPRHVSSK